MHGIVFLPWLNQPPCAEAVCSEEIIMMAVTLTIEGITRHA